MMHLRRLAAFLLCLAVATAGWGATWWPRPADSGKACCGLVCPCKDCKCAMQAGPERGDDHALAVILPVGVLPTLGLVVPASPQFFGVPDFCSESGRWTADGRGPPGRAPPLG
jgi:hypothetical protein